MRVMLGGDGGISAVPRTCKFIRERIFLKISPRISTSSLRLDWSEADLPFYRRHAHFR